MKATVPKPLQVLIALLLLASLTLPGLAETAVETRCILRGKANIVPVQRTHLVMTQSADTGLWGVYTTSGEQVLAEQFDHFLAYLGYGCYETGFSDDPIENWKALVSAEGEILSSYRYGIIRVYNRYWAAGWQVTAGTKSEYDYTPDKKTYYRIEQCDVFWLGENPGLVKRLTGEEFLRAAAHGKYLSVEDRAGGITVYDRDFHPTGFAVKKTGDAVYGVFHYALADLVTHEIILDGVSSAKEVNTPDGMLFQVTRTTYSGQKLNGICDEQGNWLMTLTGDAIVKTDSAYAVLSRDGKQGLYSYAQGRLIVPCEYDSFITNAGALDLYVSYGYACGVKDGLRHYIQVETGDVASTLDFDAKSMTAVGATVYCKTGPDIYRITSATGKSWFADECQLKTVRGDGRLIVVYAVNTGNYSVRTMDGDTALSALYRKPPVITDDGHVVLNTSNEGYILMELSW